MTLTTRKAATAAKTCREAADELDLFRGDRAALTRAAELLESYEGDDTTEETSE